MKMRLLAISIVMLALMSESCGLYWSSRIVAGSSQWSIYRESSNISFSLTSSVEGKISPIELRGRILHPFQDYYAHVGSNGVLLNQRTNSKEGHYKAIDKIEMQSRIYSDQVDIYVDKPIGSDIYTINYKNEVWPVFLNSSRMVAYSGQQINEREFHENNGDFIGESFLNNQEFTKNKISSMYLRRLNATVFSTNDSILLAEIKPIKYLGDEIKASSTGISNFRYRLSDSMFDIKHQIYPSLIEGNEQYYGKYDLFRKIEMQSIYEQTNDTDSDLPNWLSCCDFNSSDTGYINRNNLGSITNETFDCTCNKETQR